MMGLPGVPDAPGLQESWQHCGTGNGAKGMECSLPLLGVLSGELGAGAGERKGLPGVPVSGRSLGKQAELWGGKWGTVYCCWACFQESWLARAGVLESGRPPKDSR